MYFLKNDMITFRFIIIIEIFVKYFLIAYQISHHQDIDEKATYLISYLLPL